LTVRDLDALIMDGLRVLARGADSSMEAEARTILRDGVARRLRWESATLADLSGPPSLYDLETPFVRSQDLPREVGF